MEEKKGVVTPKRKQRLDGGPLIFSQSWMSNELLKYEVKTVNFLLDLKV